GVRHENYCQRDFFRFTKKCDREMLRRRHHTQTQIAGETKGRKKTDEKHRENQYSSGGVYRGTESAMTNVESRITKECRMTTPDFVAQRDRTLFSSFVLRISSFSSHVYIAPD